MKRNKVMMIGLAVATVAFLASIAQGSDKPAAPPKASASKICPNDCPCDGQGMGKGRHGQGWGGAMSLGMGQQKRYGWQQGQGPGPGKGFRGGPRDGTGPRRDGSCGQCPLKSN